MEVGEKHMIAKITESMCLTPASTIVYQIDMTPIAKAIKFGITVGVIVVAYKSIKKKHNSPDPDFDEEIEERSRNEKLRLKHNMMKDYEKWLDKKLGL